MSFFCLKNLYCFPAAFNPELLSLVFKMLPERALLPILAFSMATPLRLPDKTNDESSSRVWNVKCQCHGSHALPVLAPGIPVTALSEHGLSSPVVTDTSHVSVTSTTKVV